MLGQVCTAGESAAPAEPHGQCATHIPCARRTT